MAKAELVYGVHAVRALVERDPVGVLEIWLQERREPPALRRALSLRAASDIAVHRVSRETLDRMIGAGAHQGVGRALPAGCGGGSDRPPWTGCSNGRRRRA